MRISCFVIGGNRLLMACTEMLLQRGHDLRGVITATPQVAQWATAQGLRVIDAGSDYVSQLNQSPFDYLFSLAHLTLVPPAVLRLPLRGAINFHDGLLPRFAGLNVPAWALLHGEHIHGITWHMMTDEADAGDILKQFEFPLSDDDTALTLNAKCFDAGVRTFGALVDQLVSGALQAVPQDASCRRYFRRSQRPAGGCFLDWRQPAIQLDRLVRATVFGDYPNPFGAAKISLGDHALVVTASRPEADEVSGADRAVPGSIRAIRADGLEVVTGQGLLTIEGLAELDGRTVKIGEVATSFALKVGGQLDVPTAEQTSHRSRWDRRAARDESAWVKRLAAFQPVTALDRAQRVEGEHGIATVPIVVPPQFLQRFSDSLEDSLGAAFAAYLAVAQGLTRVDLSFKDGEPRLADGDESWLNDRVPLCLHLNTEQGFDQAVETWRQERAFVAGRTAWLRDVVGRTPELRQRPELRGGRLNVTGIELVDQFADRSAPADWTAPVLVISRLERACVLSFAKHEFSVASAEQLSHRLSAFLARVVSDPSQPLDDISCLTPEEQQQLLVDWNRTARPYSPRACIHHNFEQQVRWTPEAVAVVFEEQSLTYGELNRRANQLAAHLRTLGVKPEQLVGIFVERSVEMVVAILAVHKAGGAYVPLDPAFPHQRLNFMLQDSRAGVVITQSHLVSKLPDAGATVVRIDRDWPAIATQPSDDVTSNVDGHHLAYLIYTSGSTGRPKGVMVEHRNVINFFVAMDERVGFAPDGPNVLLAVTSLSFDISVLELLWTLARGFKVVLYSEWHRPAGTLRTASTPMRFGLFYFSSDEGERGEAQNDKYRLLIEGARFADENGFVSISTPERHFHAFGGLYPNPSVTGAALAMITRRVQIRAGSVVLPLHHPIRIAEEWAIVDNLSQGRVGLSFASGWQPVDFVIRPEAYRERHGLLYSGIETVRKLWRGETLEFADSDGKPRAIRTLPRPVQAEVPVWVTTVGSRETWTRAAELGANVLTHLLGQTIDELAEKIASYRDALRAAGHRRAGTVTLMLHTFVGDDMDEVREFVREPLTNYLASALSLVKDVASSWAAFKRRADGTTIKTTDDLIRLTTQDRQELLAYSFERYFSTSGLFGTPTHCVEMVQRLRAIGVDEIACLIDFGIDTQTVLKHLQHLNRLRIECERVATASVPEAVPASGSETIGALIRRHDVTHLQCTPSMASMIIADPIAREAIRNVRTLMIGGEAFSAGLASDLRSATSARVINMYGPTETTIWSSTYEVGGNETSTIPLGRPLANTQFYLLDERRRPVPVGAVGELYIGGDGVARGYYARPDLTAERFIDHPFPPSWLATHVQRGDTGGEPGTSAKIYRTGDLARYRADGVVEFLGRVDHQVKIRGYRIELGEIEAALAQHPDIREAVVVARDVAAGDQRLVAYYVGDPQRPIAESALRSMLIECLPSYMVPSHFVALQQFPLTPNRKIDRQALPAPLANAPTGADEPSARPANEIEAKIAGIWQEVLGIPRAGRDDRFFDLGGHSLLAIKALRLLREMFEKDIAITDLFRFPTVRTLAEYLAEPAISGGLAESQQRGAARRDRLTRRREPQADVSQ